MDFLRQENIHVLFRGNGVRDPCCPGRISDPKSMNPHPETDMECRMFRDSLWIGTAPLVLIVYRIPYSVGHIQIF